MIIKCFTGQSDLIVFEDIQSDGLAIDFVAIGITRVTMKVESIGEFDCTIEPDNTISIKLGESVNSGFKGEFKPARLVEFRGENDKGRTLIGDLIIQFV